MAQNEPGDEFVQVEDADLSSDDAHAADGGGSGSGHESSSGSDSSRSHRSGRSRRSADIDRGGDMGGERERLVDGGGGAGSGRASRSGSDSDRASGADRRLGESDAEGDRGRESDRERGREGGRSGGERSASRSQSSGGESSGGESPSAGRDSVSGKDGGDEEEEYQVEEDEEEEEDGPGGGFDADPEADDPGDRSDDSGRPREGDAGDDGDDDDDDGEKVVRKRTARRGAALKIPDEMLDNGEYFRRSSRARRATDRYGDDDSSSDGRAEPDDDFSGGDEGDDDDDDDFSAEESEEEFGVRKRRRAPVRKKGPKKVAAAVGGGHDAEEDDESGSDGDWNSAPKTKRRGRRRKTVKRARARVEEEDEEEEAAVRFNARTGEKVSYAEAGDSDSDIFDEVDMAAHKAAKAAAEIGGPPVESVALICDYRMPDEGGDGWRGTGKGKGKIPFSDFVAVRAEFNINWTGKSFRRNTWHVLEELRHVKGFKKLTNYCKLIAARHEELKQPTVTSEELEDAAILFMENREALEAYTIVDRIVAERASKAEGDEVTEYLVKWRNLPYRECTWEPASDLNTDADMKAIDTYSDRVQNALAPRGKGKRFNPFGKESRGKFRRMATQPDFLHGEGRTLREYQLKGLNWLAFSWSNNRNVILADEMGLGKTVQTVALLGWIQYMRNVPGPFLVVVPLSTIAAWVKEFERWLPDMNVVCYTGDGASREMARMHEFEPVAGARSGGTGVGFHCLLTTPELAMMDIDYLLPVRWAMIAIDEAHRLKNKDSELHLSLLELTSANRLLITGTPLQNSVGELWALLHFLDSEQFDDAQEFEESFSFGALRDEDRVSHLHNLLRPYIIRRQKVDVEKSLPSKTYNVLRVGMTSNQQQLYRWLLTKNYAKLNGKGMGPKTTLNNLLVELKKCCNHPFLFDNVEDTSVDTTVETLIRSSGKLILLDKLLLRLRERGHRVLVFSQMVRMLDILSDYCRMRGFPYQRLDGSMPNDLRVRAVDHYNAPGSNDYVFLLSTRAGGLGINLATADTVIIFDSDWNPQNDLQAESRAHRIGQTKDVKVFRLLSKETVEEDILERAKRKRVLEHLVIHGVEGDEQSKDKAKFNKKELSAILRFGAEKLFQEAPAGDPSAEGDGSVPNGASGNVLNGEDAKAEERRVMEVDDIDELLARAPAEPEDQLGAAEPNMGDSLLNAFKWNDFDPIAEEEEMTELDKANQARTAAAAKDAARKIGSLDDKIKRDLEKATAKQKAEEAALAEDDADYWDRVIPDSVKSKAVAETLDDDQIIGTRKRKKVKTYTGMDSPDGEDEKKSRKGQRGGRSKAEHGILSRKEEKSLFRSWRKFGDVSRVADILKDCGLTDRIDATMVTGLLEAALADARTKVRLAAINDDDGGDNGGAIVSAKGKPKGPPPVYIEAFSEHINARDLIRRCEDMELLGHKIDQLKTSETQFRLRRQIKPPAYGVPWKSKDDAMLLVGAYRHGVGNWALIANDSDLHLGNKISVPGTTGNDIKGAPDSTKLARRVTALLRELADEEMRSSQKKLSRRPAPGKADRKGKKGTKRGRVDATRAESSKSKKRPRVEGKEKKEKREKSSSRNASVHSEKLKSTQLDSLKELRNLSRKDGKVDAAESVRRMKACLLVLGAAIKDISDDRNKVRSSLWSYVHSACRTPSNGERLEGLYNKLAGDQRREVGGAAAAGR